MRSAVLRAEGGAAGLARAAGALAVYLDVLGGAAVGLAVEAAVGGVAADGCALAAIITPVVLAHA